MLYMIISMIVIVIMRHDNMHKRDCEGWRGNIFSACVISHLIGHIDMDSVYSARYTIEYNEFYVLFILAAHRVRNTNPPDNSQKCVFVLSTCIGTCVSSCPCSQYIRSELTICIHRSTPFRPEHVMHETGFSSNHCANSFTFD